MENMNVTSLEQLKQYSKGTLVELPPFGEGQPFRAYLKRPSMLNLAKSGKIPNELLTTANKLFTNNVVNEKTLQDNNFMESVYEVIEVLAEATFSEPTWKEIKESDITLTDEQLMFIFTYTQDGVKALNSFRGEQENNNGSGVSKPVQKTTKRNTKPR